VATGHYARIVAGELRTARDTQKDQTYYLFGIDRAALPRTMFPLGDMTKAEVRAVAKAAGLPVAEKAESMEICFVTSGDYRDVVRARGGGGRPGRFVDAEGRELGHHDGIDGFTVGQRRGLPALGKPRYVAAIDAGSGNVTLVAREGLDRRTARLSAVHWLVEQPGRAVAAQVKVRARHQAVPATVVADGTTAHIEFAEPVAAITPGQAAVVYAGDRVLGGGWID
jgi:tRNA-specific 2-thiouridylase